MTPLYFDPAVGLSSTVAFTLFTPSANWLYFSRSSSRVASLTRGCASCFTLVVFFIAPPPQPQENTTSVSQAIHFNARLCNRGHPYSQSEQSNNHIPAGQLSVTAEFFIQWGRAM